MSAVDDSMNECCRQCRGNFGFYPELKKHSSLATVLDKRATRCHFKLVPIRTSTEGSRNQLKEKPKNIEETLGKR